MLYKTRKHRTLVAQTFVFVPFIAFMLLAMLIPVSNLAQTSQARPILSASILSTNAQIHPFRIGLSGNYALMLANAPLVGIARLPERFLAPFDNDNMQIQGLGGGIEMEYSFVPWLALGLRGEYAQMQARAVTVQQLPRGTEREPSPIQGQPAPTTIERRSTLTFSTQSLGITPFLRLRLWDVLTLSFGVKIDSIVQMPFSYQVAIDSTQGRFVNNSLPVREFIPPNERQNFSGRRGLSISPMFGIGATFNIGRITLLPEIQIRTEYQPFLATNWNLVTVRGNLSILLNFPLPPKPTVQEIQPLESNKQQFSQEEARKQDTTTFAANRPRVQPATTASVSTANLGVVPQSNVQQSNMPQSNAQQRERQFIAPKDTVLQRDTTVRLIAWQEAASVEFLGRTSSREDSTLIIVERYRRNIPKPRPFLVTNLRVRFIPTLGAAKIAETMQASRLQTHTMIVRRFAIDSVSLVSGKQRVQQQQDTINAVRMPIVRLQPEISSELGIESSVVEVFSPEGIVLERFAVQSKRSIDWDMQHIFLKPENVDLVEIVGAGSPLRSVLTATDAEGQIRRSDTINILIESSSVKAVTAPVSSRTQGLAGGLAGAVQQTPPKTASRSIWLVATLPIPLEEEINSLEEPAGSTNNEQVLKAVLERLPRGKQLPCTLYVNAAGNDVSALQYAQTLAMQVRLSGLQARIIRRAQTKNTMPTLELVTMLE